MTEKKRGRPTKAPTPGERVSLGLRVTAEMKERLDAEATKNGRSQSQEAEYRLERSFGDERLFSSPEIRFWAIMKAGRFADEGRFAAAQNGHVEWSDKEWMADPNCRLKASFEVIDSLIKDVVAHGTNPEDTAIYIESLKSRFINHLLNAGKATITWKEEDDNAR
ncbi:TraY domain-containing protein [Mesorhizobium sp.]|uniref:TraY domain-containing protein n=1 Tax=Mesorhizobium sp. TaxID=1871066 RepID=UPI000FD309D3|nr:TraY domain-containing protein [Mesorhizobium sp.]RVC57680.1 TraY domain-containing protein [Mesorhizobium sp. M4B.F.Ca.ET.088.02.2.1]RWF32430.1 MAG: TraY domain-containing protein [Mesorhizobium sp.]